MEVCTTKTGGSTPKPAKRTVLSLTGELKPTIVKTRKRPDSTSAPSLTPEEKRLAFLTAVTHAYPAAFDLRHPTPLAIGTGAKLIAQSHSLGLSRRHIRFGLGWWTSRIPYLRACVDGAARVDLSGRPDGEVNAKAAAWAAEEVERRGKVRG